MHGLIDVTDPSDIPNKVKSNNITFYVDGDTTCKLWESCNLTPYGKNIHILI